MESMFSSDKKMWNIWMSMWHLATVTAAHELSYFKQLGNNTLTLNNLAEHLGISFRATEVLTRILAGLELVNFQYPKVALSSTAKDYLIPTSPAYWGNQLKSLYNRTEHQQILVALRKNTALLTHKGTTFTDMWKNNSLTPEAAKHFTEQMQATHVAPAKYVMNLEIFNNIKKLLDVGGGSACFSISFVENRPNVGATVFDLPPVCDVASEYIAKSVHAQRVKLQAGNFFMDKWPKDHDGAFFSQILHDWPIDTCKKLIQMAYDALPAGGKIFIHEMVLDNNNHFSPLVTACFDLLMFINHGSQQFTQNEIFDLLTSEGFSNPSIAPGFGNFSVIYATK